MVSRDAEFPCLNSENNKKKEKLVKGWLLMGAVPTMEVARYKM